MKSNLMSLKAMSKEKMAIISTPVWLLFAGLIAFGFSNGVVRAIAQTSTVLEVSFWMAAGTVFGIWASSWFNMKKIYRLPSPKTAAIYICLQVMAFFLFVLAISLGPASLVGAFFPLEAVVGVVLAAVFLKERFGGFEASCVAISVLGAIVVASDTGLEGGFATSAIVASLASSMAFGAAIPAVRLAAQVNSTRSLAAWYASICVVLTVPANIAIPSPELLWLFAISSLIKPVAEICYSSGMARAPVSLAASCLPLLGLITAFWAWVIAGEVPTKMTLVGGALIASASIGALLHQSRRARLRARMIIPLAE